ARGNGVGKHSFHVALAFGDFTDFAARCGSHLLVSNRLEEFSYTNAASVARGAARGQNVIGADGFVAVGNGGFFAGEQRAVIGQILHEGVFVLDVQLQMFGRVIVAEGDGFIDVVGDVDDAVVAPGKRGDVARGKSLKLFLDLCDGAARERFAQAHQINSAVRV